MEQSTCAEGCRYEMVGDGRCNPECQDEPLCFYDLDDCKNYPPKLLPDKIEKRLKETASDMQ
jgi:hypothetical protein